LFQYIFTCFDIPGEFVTDQGAQFTSNLAQTITEKYTIKQWNSSPYHPQVNGQVEATNKVLEDILTKTIHIH
jgi:transposase InsO family protein